MPEVRHKGKPGAKGGTRAASAKGKLSGAVRDALRAAFEPPRPATEAPEDGRAIIARRQAGLVRYDGKRPKVRAPTAALPCSVVSRASGIAAQGQRQQQQLGLAGGRRPRPAQCRRVRQRRVGRAALWSTCLHRRLAPARCASVGACVGIRASLAGPRQAGAAVSGRCPRAIFAPWTELTARFARLHRAPDLLCLFRSLH